MSRVSARRAAKAKKLSVRELARRAHLSPSAVSRILSGKRTPSLPNALKLSKLLNVKPDVFSAR